MYYFFFYRDSSFSITEDTHVILSENQEGIHAYVSAKLIFESLLTNNDIHV